MEIVRDRCAAAVRDPALLATDLADYLVLQGVPFRTAHHAVGAVVRLAEQKKLPLNRLALADVQSVHPAFTADWAKVFDLRAALAKRTGPGMPGPQQLAKQFARWQRLLG
jgi:argininosuccinate lyase